MRTYKTVSITLPPAMLARALALAEREQRSMSELVREALRTYERQASLQDPYFPATRRNVEEGLAQLERGEYTDYDAAGLRKLGKTIIADVRKKRATKAKRSPG